MVIEFSGFIRKGRSPVYLELSNIESLYKTPEVKMPKNLVNRIYGERIPSDEKGNVIVDHETFVVRTKSGLEITVSEEVFNTVLEQFKQVNLQP